jgi:lipoyl(octanoyl) transferase
MKSNIVHVIDWGTIPFDIAWEKQKQLLQQVVAIKLNNRKHELQTPTPNYFIFCEHPHVYTLGKSGKESNLLIDRAFLQQINAQYYHIDRGGDITYHGPGQIVGYLIFDLDNFVTDLHIFLRTIEHTIITALAAFGVTGDTFPPNTGVWIEPQSPQARKICAIGIKCSHWVSMHGFALNVNTNLKYFDYIIPCAIKDKAVTSLQTELHQFVSLEAVKVEILKALSANFSCTIKNID